MPFQVHLGIDWGNNWTCLAYRVDNRSGPQVHVPQASSVVRLKKTAGGIDVEVPDRRLNKLLPASELYPYRELPDLKHIIRCIGDSQCQLPALPGLLLERISVPQGDIQEPDIAIKFRDDTDGVSINATQVMLAYWRDFIRTQYSAGLGSWAQVSGIMVTIPATTPQPVIHIYRRIVKACWPDLAEDALHFVVESEAAIFKWVQDHHSHNLRVLNKRKVMVIDIGDSTLDICLMSCKLHSDGRFLATTLVSQCSQRLVGRAYSSATVTAIRRKIADDMPLFRQRQAVFKHDFNSDDVHKIKEALSFQPYPSQQPARDEPFHLTSLLSPEFNATLEEFKRRYGQVQNTFMDQVYSLAYLYDAYQPLHKELSTYLEAFMQLPDCSPIHHVLITGGAAMTWGLQDTLRLSFNTRTKMELPTVKCQKDTVALGALWSKDPHMGLQSITNVDLGITFEYSNSSTLHLHRIIPAGSLLPASEQSQRLLYATKLVHNKMQLDVVEGRFAEGDEFDPDQHVKYIMYVELDEAALRQVQEARRSVKACPPVCARFTFSPNFVLTVDATAGQVHTRKLVMVETRGNQEQTTAAAGGASGLAQDMQHIASSPGGAAAAAALAVMAAGGPPAGDAAADDEDDSDGDAYAHVHVPPAPAPPPSPAALRSTDQRKKRLPGVEPAVQRPAKVVAAGLQATGEDKVARGSHGQSAHGAGLRRSTRHK